MKHIFDHFSTYSATSVNIVLPYITLGVTEGVLTQTVPTALDGVSLPINTQFPLGSHNESTVYVSCTICIK